MKRMMILYAAMVMSWCVIADTEIVDGIEWTYTVSDGEASVGVYRTWYDYETAIPNSTTGEIAIPSTLGGFPIKHIGAYAFYGCSELTSVTIPSSVTSIGWQAFYGCSGLTSVVIPEGVTAIDSGLFGGCASIASVTIPLSVTNIGDDAFYGCRGLTSVTIPNSVKSIGNSTFRYCIALTNITIPSSVTRIESYAFAGCIGFTNVAIPLSVTNIGDRAFSGCRGLTSVSLSSSVKSIGAEVFEHCDGLTSLTMSNSVTSIGESAFCGCRRLTSVTVSNGVTSIRDCTFEDCDGLTSVTIPESVASIGESSFRNCSGLKSVIIPSSVTNIGYLAFSGCIGLKTIYVDEGDEDRVRDLLEDSEFDTDQVRFVVKGAMPIFEVVAGMKVDEYVGFENYKAKGLPKGLTYNAKTGKVTGTCKVVGEYEVTFTKKGAEDETVVFIVRAEKNSTIVCEGLAGGAMIVGVAGGAVGGGTPTLPISINAESGVKSVTATKLPTGMKIASSKDKTSWYITGAPTKAGTYEVAITLTTAAGNKVTEKFTVTVAALPSGATGTFNGFVQKPGSGEGETLNAGSFQVTVSDVGKITAKIVATAGTYSFTATGWDSTNEGVYSVKMTTKKGDVLTLACDSAAAWNAKQMTGTFSPVDAIVSIASAKDNSSSSDAFETNASTYAVEAQKNAFGKQWFFNAELAAREGTSSTEECGSEAWVLSFAENAKAAALTVTLNADGKTAVAGTLYGVPVTSGNKTTTPSYKISASGYADVSGIAEGAIFADFAPVISVKNGKTTTKKTLSLRVNLWFDKKGDHEQGVGSAVFVP